MSRHTSISDTTNTTLQFTTQSQSDLSRLSLWLPSSVRLPSIRLYLLSPTDFHRLPFSNSQISQTDFSLYHALPFHSILLSHLHCHWFIYARKSLVTTFHWLTKYKKKTHSSPTIKLNCLVIPAYLLILLLVQLALRHQLIRHTTSKGWPAVLSLQPQPQ